MTNPNTTRPKTFKPKPKHAALKVTTVLSKKDRKAIADKLIAYNVATFGPSGRQSVAIRPARRRRQHLRRIDRLHRPRLALY
jgi:hypothetical protein